MVIMSFFVAMDLISGSVAAIKRGENFSSKKLRNTVTKFIGYSIAVIVAWVLQNNFIEDFPLMRLVGVFICYIELKSINENVEALTNLNVFKAVLDQLKFEQKKERK